MFQWFPVEASLLAAVILISFACPIHERSLSSLPSRSFLLSSNLSLSSLTSLLSSSSPSGNYLFEANELFSATRSIEKKNLMPIHQSTEHNNRFDRLSSRYNLSSNTGHKNTRKRRNTDQDCNYGLCCLKSIYFDFHEHGMDNIVRPSGFNMNFCEGECIMQIETNDRNALILQERKNHPEGPLWRRLSCCVPIRWSSIEIVENRNGIEFNRILENVKVMECGCAI
ncbi:hypothetical protein LOAG_03298 [Loa loa]|uniref:TGF-beta family profile domain-containing protein n=1 Tax=Loa loa TaxID=7209 RepID=A0A1S0U531_LOALO|nr:hypothetical protein LOAG_03298 [Loa loa]EFO25184.1 hypothetical protein LOAG_03298 [Loa loa]